MKNLMKKTALIAVFLISLVALAGFVSASDETSNYKITKIELDDDVVGPNDVTAVERGETLEVEVTILGISNDTVDAVRVTAEIEGWEFDDIEDRTDFFTVRPGVKYVKVLTLEIPDDIDTQEQFTLRVEAKDSSEEAEVKTVVETASARHEVNINDVVFRSGDVVSAGDTVVIDVWVENDGDKDEEDIDVRLSIPELGLSSRAILDELVTDENEGDSDRDRDTDTDFVRFTLKIPSNTPSGEYDVESQVIFNRGKDVDRQTETLVVSGTTPSTAGETDTVITLDSVSKEVAAGEGAVFKLMFANLGNEAQTFSVSVSGTESFGSSRVDPGFVTVQPGQSGEMFVFVTARDNVASGAYPFKASISTNGQVVREVTLQTEVTAGSTTTSNGSDLDNVRRGLEIGFVVLLIILVILGIIIAIGKLRGDGDSLEKEPTTAEGQTYYYYPRY